MKVAFDVDGVFTNLERFQLHYGRKYFKNVKEQDIHMDEIDIEDIFNCTRSEREKFWIKYIWKYCFMPYEEGISALIRQLKEKGDEIFIVTGRAHTTETGITGKLFRAMLFHMIKKEGIPYDHIFFCSEKDSDIEKPIICEQHGIDVIIDDKKENIDSISKVTNVICRDRIYNRDYTNPKVPRVKNTNQMYVEIEKLRNPNYFEKLHHEDISKMNTSQKIKYFEQLRKYYSELPFDDIKYQKTEKNYKILSKVGLAIYNRFAEPTVFNRELVPNEEGVLFISNHNNYYDQFPIISAIGDHRPIHFLTATKMLKMKRGAIYLKTGAISVDREDKDDREFAKDEINKLLAHEKNVFIFPEGRTNRGEDFLLPFQPGAAASAQATGCLVVPTAVSFNDPKSIKESIVRFGKPFRVSPTEKILDKTQEMMNIVGDLKQKNIDWLEKNRVKVKSRTKKN
ncbi:MAG: hypothetical protein HFJ12_07040 [Bacilli bacterium]|nr:hypothetical protein [Bacilli bacterium]